MVPSGHGLCRWTVAEIKVGDESIDTLVQELANMSTLTMDAVPTGYRVATERNGTIHDATGETLEEALVESYNWWFQ